MRSDGHRLSPLIDGKDFWSETRVAGFQFRKIKGILRHASLNLPFYQRRFKESGFDPAAVRSLDDFWRAPTFKKVQIIQEVKSKGYFDFAMEDAARGGPAVLCMTSGTLGTTFLHLPRKWRSIRGDSLLRAYWWCGLRPGMRMLMAAPAWHSLAVPETRIIEKLGVACVIPWGTFLPRFSGNFISVLTELKPDFVSMFLPMLYALVAELRRRRVAPATAFRSVKSLLLVGAPMTPRSRETLRDELGVSEIFEGLGNPEGLTAMECSFHCGHHIFMDGCYVEILDPKTGDRLPPGKRGTVVITSLIPYGSIYIRYDTEDLGEILPGSCACGRSWPLMEVYDRRTNIVQVAGKEIVPYDVRLCVDAIPELVGIPFALVRAAQTKPYVKLVIQKHSAAGSNGIENRLKNLIGEQLQLEAEIEWAAELPERWKGVTVIEEKDWRAAHV
ncbi:MAG: phenylacetate--CoA ligase family protein [Alphaproteobacteria bacterium]